MSADFGSDRQGDDLERLCADALRVLAMDQVEAADSGHPGMPMGMADVAHVLWSEHLRLDPRDPAWLGRDRFVLSAGHGSALLYALLHLSGHDLPMSELQRFRQLDSKTPGHPEVGHTPGVETTTGPLGQGFANAVGMALAERHLVGRWPQAADALAHRTFVICGDGDLMEGLSAEAASLAGHLELHRLIVLWDDNGISIDGPTTLAFGEDVLTRFAGHGWRTDRCDGHDLADIRRALAAAVAEAERRDGGGKPTLIACKTTIGKFAPTKAGTADVHGSPLGKAELAAAKAAMGWPQEPFLVPDAVRLRWGARKAAWSEARAAWDRAWDALPAAAAKEVQAWFGPAAPGLAAVAWPSLPAGKADATRNASGKALQALAAAVPNLVGGSADLSPSNKTLLKGTPDFSPGDYAGRNLRFGVREHAMGAILNGIALHGGLIPYGGTFLTFTDYARPAMRLSALMGTRVVWVMTHDSIYLGEDGPTHQPVEHLMALRVIPGLRVFRPADTAETVVGWRLALEHRGPTVLALTRQNVPELERADPDGPARGGYVLWEAGDGPQVVLIATGSEVHVALAVARALHAEDGRAARVVSLPCWELFEAQPLAWREQVIPPRCGARVSLEAGVTFGWERYTGELGLRIGVDAFGASAPAEHLAVRYGLDAPSVLARVRAYLAETL